jgi:hypothetical protein
MFEGKNYILSKENGNKVLIKEFAWYKITGLGFFIGLLLLGVFLLSFSFDMADYSSILWKNLIGIFLIFLGLLSLFISLPLKMKVTEFKNEFLIEKINSFWIKKEFKINKSKKPIILGVKIRSLQGKIKYIDNHVYKYIGNHLYNLRISYTGGEIRLHYRLVPGGYTHLSNPEQIREIAHFFRLPYKLIER